MYGKRVLEMAVIIGLLSVLAFALMPTASGDPVKTYGYLLDSETEYSIEDAEVTFYDLATADTYTYNTPSSGYYEVYLPSGSYQIVYYHVNYQTVYDFLEVTEEENKIFLNFSEMTAYPEFNTTLSGYVTSDGDPVKAVTIHIYNETTGAWNENDTDTDGYYEIDFMYGDAVLTWDKSGSNKEHMRETADISLPMNVSYNVTLDKIELNVVSVFVWDDETEDPIDGARVYLHLKKGMIELWDDSDYGPFDAYTESDGSAQIEAPDGTYVAVIDAPGYDAQIISTIVIDSDTNWLVPEKIVRLIPLGAGDVMVDVIFGDDWDATAEVTVEIFEDQATWKYFADLELYSLFHDYGFGMVEGPSVMINGSTLGDGGLGGDELTLITDLQIYSGIPDDFAELIIAHNGSNILYTEELADVTIDTGAWTQTYDIDLTREEMFEDVFVTLKCDVSYNGYYNYSYTYDLPTDWYYVGNISYEDLTITEMVNGFDIVSSDGSGTVKVQVDVSNDDETPTAFFKVDNFCCMGMVNESVDVEFNATKSMDNGTASGIVEWRWDFGEGNMTNATKDTTKFAYDVPGEFMVGLVVVDRAGRVSDEYTMKVPIHDITAPKVKVNFTSAIWDEDNVSLSIDMVNDTLSVEVVMEITDPDWFNTADASYIFDLNYTVYVEFGDGSNETVVEDADWTDGVTTVKISHTYMEAGVYEIMANATDNWDNYKENEAGLILVDKMVPVPDFFIEKKNKTSKELETIGFDELEEESEVVFNGSISEDNSRVQLIKWDFGDGTFDNKTGDDTDIGDSNMIVKHKYHKPGNFTVTAKVYDNWTNWADVSYVVTVADTQDPEAKFTSWVMNDDGDIEEGNHVDEGENITFNGTDSTDTSEDMFGNETIAYYFWEFGDNETMNGTDAIVDHKFEEPGTYTVNLTVGDQAGFWHRISKPATVVAGEKVDFVIKNFTMSHGRVRKGDKVTAKVVVTNIGDVDLNETEELSVSIKANGKVISTKTIMGLEIDEEKELSFSWKPGRGSYEIIAVVDVDDDWDEMKTDGSGEDNNEAEDKLFVEKEKEEELTLYLVITAIVVLVIVFLIFRRKRGISKMEDKLHGKKDKSESTKKKSKK